MATIYGAQKSIKMASTSKRFSDSGIKLGNNRLWRARGGPEPKPKCHVEPLHTHFVGGFSDRILYQKLRY
jgi:hypothetical protein